MRIATWLTWISLAYAGASGCATEDPAVAPAFELSRFEGRWYEIARVPRDYDAECHDTVADYRLTQPGELELLHSCHLGSAQGSLSQFRAFASVDDPKVPAKLSLELGLYRGDYWVLEVGENYEYAVIGHPSRTMLWILSRSPKLDDATWAHALDTAARQGFGTHLLRRTPQSGAEL